MSGLTFFTTATGGPAERGENKRWDANVKAQQKNQVSQPKQESVPVVSHSTTPVLSAQNGPVNTSSHQASSSSEVIFAGGCSAAERGELNRALRRGF